MNLFKFGCTVAAASCVAASVTGCATPPPAAEGGKWHVALVGVDVVDVVNGVTLPRQTVIVRDGIIRQMGNAGQVRVPSGATTVVGTGKTLIPGLWDMHTHVSAAGDCALPTMVTYGVTGLRNMGDDIPVTRRMQQAVAEGRLVGPEMLIASPPFESRKWLDWVAKINKKPWQDVIGVRVPVEHAAEAVEQVRAIAATGADLIKIRNLPDDDSYRAVLTEAQRQKVLVAGHVTAKAMVQDVFNAGTQDSVGAAGKGMASIEHVEGVTRQLGPLEPAKRRTFFEAMRRHGTMLTPTLVTHKFFRTKASTFKRNIEDGSLNPDASSQLRLKSWKEIYDLFEAQKASEKSQSTDDAPDPKMVAHITTAEEDAATAASVGVEMLTGTDLAVPLVVPGQSLHEEMELMVKTMRMKPADVLRAATYNPAKASRLEKTTGRVAPGYRASLVLLSRNPLEDISAVRGVVGVFLSGRYFSEADLNILRATTRQAIREDKQCTKPAAG